MKLFIIPVRVLDLPMYLIQKITQKTFTLKVRTQDQKIFKFNAEDVKMQMTSGKNPVLSFVIALTGYGAKDIDRFFFLNQSEELLYVSRPGTALRHELEKIYIGDAL